MIKNEIQYEYTQELLKDAEEALARSDWQTQEANTNAPENAVGRSALQSHRDAFQAEIDEYDRWVSWERTQKLEIHINSILELPKVLIGARIAAKMTQKELAQRLGLSEQRIQQYEDSDYQCASWLEIIDVTEALAIDLKSANFVVDFNEIEKRTQLLVELGERQPKKIKS
ncbi:helix-turn-helix transcriptional regulator [Oscillatoria sp. FACHB-1406]|uniref:helix-turn-helix domain-containing protein n=1 Tax=Oscillatoria sp. FACHB-1406 TaxID=2692846 RepID=UPI0016831B87|nr:helix-turn-helix transcriptional regulator [Oscillatoria sp. FACHB-1406]MBD2580115.1 helix-turn-helix transcriptional regulator [Oscillatoria sp. FACHB-1406]